VNPVNPPFVIRMFLPEAALRHCCRCDVVLVKGCDLRTALMLNGGRRAYRGSACR
jgi:hypothetical protein